LALPPFAEHPASRAGPGIGPPLAGFFLRKEANGEGIHDVLTFLFWHHWIGHGVVLFVLFFGLGLLFSRSSVHRDARKITPWVIGATILGAGLIVVFYVLENLGIQ